MASDNPRGVRRPNDEPENQQERPARQRAPESSETIRRTSETSDKEMVRAARRRAGTTPCVHLVHRTREPNSEIPCRVSSDPHERCNDLAAVSRRDPAKLRYP